MSFRATQIGLASLILSTALGLSSCTAVQPTNSPTPLAPTEASPAVSTTATPNEATVSEADFVAVTQVYEQKVGADDNAYVELEPLLSGRLPEGLGDDIEAVSLEDEKQRKLFRQKVLPVLRTAFKKKAFAAREKLQAAEIPVNYRGLRVLVSLVMEEADTALKAGDFKTALELAELPLFLADAMQARPETVSANLFSSGYAEASVSWAQEVLETSELKPEQITALEEMLSRHSPKFKHIKDSVRVDFAQLWNSLETEEGRNMLGIGQVEDSTLATLRSQLLDIYGLAEKLYDGESVTAEAFNQSVMSASGPIQGIVIDYPDMATMQKRAFAKYKATQLGLALVGPEGPKLSQMTPEKQIEAEFQGDEETTKTLKEMLQVDVDAEAGRVRILGNPEEFELIARGGDVVLFEYSPTP